MKIKENNVDWVWVQVQDQAEFVPADLITEKKRKTSNVWRRPSNWIRYGVLTLVTLTGALALWSAPSHFLQRSTAVLLVTS